MLETLIDSRPDLIGTIAADPLGMGEERIVTFRDLAVWQLSMDLVDMVIASLKELPRTEFDIRRQIFRAATSMPSNIAEGYRRKKKRGAYQNHVSIALGSQGELDTQLEICLRNSFMGPDTCKKVMSLNDRVGAMLYRLHESLG